MLAMRRSPEPRHGGIPVHMKVHHFIEELRPRARFRQPRLRHQIDHSITISIALERRTAACTFVIL